MEDQALRETLGRAASQLYAALSERMTEAEPEAEVVGSLQTAYRYGPGCSHLAGLVPAVEHALLTMIEALVSSCRFG